MREVLRPFDLAFLSARPRLPFRARAELRAWSGGKEGALSCFAGLVLCGFKMDAETR